MGFPGGSLVNNLPTNARDTGDAGSRRSSGGVTDNLLHIPAKISQGHKSLADHNPGVTKESDTTEHRYMKILVQQHIYGIHMLINIFRVHN